MKDQRPGMFTSPGQAAGYLLAWLFVALGISVVLALIVVVWRWILSLVTGS